MPNRRIIRRKVITASGTHYVTQRHTPYGTEHLTRQTINGVRRLVPMKIVTTMEPLKELLVQDIDLSNVRPGNASATAGLKDLVDANNFASMGGRIRPTRNLIMREIAAALRKR